MDLRSEREPFGAARAACFEEVAGVSASSGALHYAKDIFKPEEMVLRSKYPPIFWSRLCESCKIAYFRQFPWVSIKKSSCFLIENAVAWCSVAHSSEKQSLIQSWLPCHQGNEAKWPACFSRWSLVVNLEYAGFRGQTAPTGSFSAKTLPVGPKYHAFGTSYGTIRQTFEQNSACRSSEWFYQLTFSIDPHMFCRNSNFNCLVVVQFLKSPCISQVIEIYTEINI